MTVGGDLGSMVTLKGYERERWVKNQVVMSATDGLEKMFRTENKAIRFVRGLGMDVLQELEGVKGLIMKRESIKISPTSARGRTRLFETETRADLSTRSFSFFLPRIRRRRRRIRSLSAQSPYLRSSRFRRQWTEERCWRTGRSRRKRHQGCRRRRSFDSSLSLIDLDALSSLLLASPLPRNANENIPSPSFLFPKNLQASSCAFFFSCSHPISKGGEARPRSSRLDPASALQLHQAPFSFSSLPVSDVRFRYFPFSSTASEPSDQQRCVLVPVWMVGARRLERGSSLPSFLLARSLRFNPWSSILMRRKSAADSWFLRVYRLDR